MAASKSPQLRLFHIRDEIEGVTTAIRDLSFDQYRESFMLRRAAERALQIISEAAKALAPELTAQYPDAPWSAIVGIGNVLEHVRRFPIRVGFPNQANSASPLS